jgi:6-phosphogluconate dehydrogenase
MQIGLVGLGKMGAIVARRLLRGGHAVVGHDLDGERGAALAAEGLDPAASLDELVERLEAPRVVWLMLPAGKATEHVAGALASRLSAGDVVIEAANSDPARAPVLAQRLAGDGVTLLDVGVSGGIWGLDHGAGLLVGGTEDDVERAAPAFDAVAAPGGWGHVGPVGAGHWAKMVHNAVEYGVMQAYAEGYELLGAGDVEVDVAKTLATWNIACSVRSWLLGHFADAVAANPSLDGVPAWVDDSGQGRWSVDAAVRAAVPVPVIAAALFARFGSRQQQAPAMQGIAAMRQQVGGHRPQVRS